MIEQTIISLQTLAHAFGQTYNLPLPLWLFLFGGAATVIVSFMLANILIGRKPDTGDQLKSINKTIPINTIKVASLVSAVIYGVLIIGGVIGDQSLINNISPTIFWVVLFVAFAHVSVLLGNIWQFINPFNAILDGLEYIAGNKFEAMYAYPKKLRYIPAVVVYFILIWLETISGGWGIVPINLSVILFTYGIVTILGVALYGRDAWLRYGDFFSIFFELFGRISVFKYIGNKIYVRPLFVGLLEKSKKSLAFLLFVLFMLSSTAFDGLRETAIYDSFIRFLANAPATAMIGRSAIDTVVLLVSPFAFFAIYWVCIFAMRRIVKSKYSVMELAIRFSSSLIPIAIAYNIAHYFTVVLIQGQLIFKLASDPFGLGWNLSHTASYTINTGIISAASVWYIQIALIIAGHIAAVYLAHLIALKTFASNRQALLSQYPMLALMVIYTMTSLWIISQSITSTT